MKALLILPAERVVRQIDLQGPFISIPALLNCETGRTFRIAAYLDISVDADGDKKKGLAAFSIGHPEQLLVGNAIIMGPNGTQVPVEISSILAMIRWTELQSSGEVGIGRQIADVYHNGLPILEVRDGERFLIWSVVHGQWMGASGTPADAERYSRQRAIDIFHRNHAMLPIREIDAIAAGLVK